MSITRRKFVSLVGGGAVVLPLAGLLQSLNAADMPKVNPDDSTAKSLNYTHQSADAKRLCSGCQFYSDPAAAEWGPCVIFPGQVVSANGVCTSWFKRAG